VISKFTSSISIVAWIDESEKEKQPWSMLLCICALATYVV
jgi:hypothetical protein